MFLSKIKDQTFRKTNNQLSFEVEKSIQILVFEEWGEEFKGIAKKTCKIVPILYNEERTRYKDLRTGKIYPVILDGSQLSAIIEHPDISTRPTIKTTRDYNKTKDIREFYNWYESQAYVDFSQLENDVGIKAHYCTMPESKNGKHLETYDINQFRYKMKCEDCNTFKDILKMAQQWENERNKGYEIAFKESLDDAKKLEKRKKREEEQVNKFLNF